jgi:hypothetical protein
MTRPLLTISITRLLLIVAIVIVSFLKLIPYRTAGATTNNHATAIAPNPENLRNNSITIL